jgi:hypothetical protein
MRSWLLLSPLLLGQAMLAANCRAPVDWNHAAAGSAGSGGEGSASAGMDASAGGSHSGIGGSEAAPAGEGGQDGGGGGKGGAVEGGAGGFSNDGAHAGAAGRLDEVECRNDTDCGSGNVCDGGERCRNGICTTEEVPICERGTECIDRDGELACEFPTQSAWLAFRSFAEVPSVQALRTADGHEPAPASPSSPPEVLKLFETGHSALELMWSPSGRYLVAKEVWFENPLESREESRLLWSFFGRGLPTRAEPVPNLPTSGDYEVLMWDSATDAMLVRNGSERYVVRFDGARANPVLALMTDEDPALWLCSGAEALLYRTDRDYLVPVGAAPDSERVDLGALTDPSPDYSKLVGVRPGETSGSQVLFSVDCRVGATPTVLREVEGISWQYSWSADSRLLLLVTTLAERSELELIELDHPDAPIFSGEFTTGRWSPDGGLLLLESASPDVRYHLLELAGGEPQLLAIDAADVVEWCGQYLLIHRRNPETFAWRTHVLEPRSWTEPRLLIPESTDSQGQLLCDGAERVAYVRYTSTEQRIEIATLSAPDAPPLSYSLGPPIHIDLAAFHPDERGLIAALPGPQTRIWWLPMPGGVPATARELPETSVPRVQPWP